jgi:hypothetical protein
MADLSTAKRNSTDKVLNELKQSVDSIHKSADLASHTLASLLAIKFYTDLIVDLDCTTTEGLSHFTDNLVSLIDIDRNLLNHLDNKAPQKTPDLVLAEKSVSIFPISELMDLLHKFVDDAGAKHNLCTKFQQHVVSKQTDISQITNVASIVTKQLDANYEKAKDLLEHTANRYSDIEESLDLIKKLTTDSSNFDFFDS